MIVRVGTANPAKVRATRSAFRLFLPRARVVGVDVPSGVPAHPKTLAQIVRGARHRARRAFRGCDYAVGIEAGTFRLRELGSKTYLITVVCVTDGRRESVAGSPFFEFPASIRDPGIRGLVGALTRRKITREEVTRTAVALALAVLL